MIVTIENPADVTVVAARPYGQRATLKYCAYTGAQAMAGRFTPGSFTNYTVKNYREPRLIIVTDPRTDSQVRLPKPTSMQPEKRFFAELKLPVLVCVLASFRPLRRAPVANAALRARRLRRPSTSPLT